MYLIHCTIHFETFWHIDFRQHNASIIVDFLAHRHGARAAQLEPVLAALQRGALRVLVHLDPGRRGAHQKRALHEERDPFAGTCLIYLHRISSTGGPRELSYRA